MKVYLAGPMENDPSTQENVPTQWRRVVIEAWKGWKFTTGPIEFLCPEFVGKAHDTYDATVEADLEMIRQSDIVLACVDSGGREGTFIEMGYAHALDIPVVGLYYHNLLDFRGSFSSTLCQDWVEYLCFDHAFANAACALIVWAVATKHLSSTRPNVHDIALAHESISAMRDYVREEEGEKAGAPDYGEALGGS